MRSEMKYTQNQISSHHEKNSVYSNCHCGRNEMKYYFGVGRSETVHQKYRQVTRGNLWIWLPERG